MQFSTATGLVAVAGLEITNAIAIAAGTTHGLAVLADGAVIGWGWNRNGQASGLSTVTENVAAAAVVIGGQPLTNAAAISAGDGMSVAVRTDGSLAVWGSGSGGGREGGLIPPAGLTNAVAAAAGYNHGIAVLRGGTVACWGPSGGPLSEVSHVIAIDASDYWAGHDLALQRGGTVVEWDNRVRRPALVAGLTNAIAVSSGWGHRLALRQDGTVFGWGANRCGEATGVPTKTAPSDPFGTSGVVTLNGNVLSNIVAVAAGNDYSLALGRDGSIVTWGLWGGSYSPPVPAGLSNVVAIAAGEGFCLAITTNGAVAEKFNRKK